MPAGDELERVDLRSDSVDHVLGECHGRCACWSRVGGDGTGGDGLDLGAGAVGGRWVGGGRGDMAIENRGMFWVLGRLGAI
jgi:hypothetical protein